MTTLYDPQYFLFWDFFLFYLFWYNFSLFFCLFFNASLVTLSAKKLGHTSTAPGYFSVSNPIINYENDFSIVIFNVIFLHQNFERDFQISKICIFFQITGAITQGKIRLSQYSKMPWTQFCDIRHICIFFKITSAITQGKIRLSQCSKIIIERWWFVYLGHG